ncbi:hypothetical protein D9M69_391890 [compost metagenome]
MATCWPITTAPTAACWPPCWKWPSPATAAWTSTSTPWPTTVKAWPPSCSTKNWARSSRFARTPRRKCWPSSAPPASVIVLPSSASRSTAPTFPSASMAKPCSAASAACCSASGPRPAIVSSVCVTTPIAPTRSSTHCWKKTTPACRSSSASTSTRTSLRPTSRKACVRRWRSSASRASTARWKWLPPSTAPASPPSTCT